MIERVKKANTFLRLERKKRGWSQARLAELIGADSSMISRWECGARNPEPTYQAKLCELFHKNAVELGFIELPVPSPSASRHPHFEMQPTFTGVPSLASEVDYSMQETEDAILWFGFRLAHILRIISLWSGQLGGCDEVQNMVDQEIKVFDEKLQRMLGQEEQRLSRRQALVTIAALPTTVFSISKPLGLMTDLFTEEFLPQCAASITACWHLLRGKGFVAVEEIVPKFLPLLGTIALHPSKYQQAAAGLATQASIIQGILAMHRLNFPVREAYCNDALRYARLSQDSKLGAVAFMYLGYTYSHCYYPSQPQKALLAFQQALHALGNEVSLLRSDIFMGMGEASAQCREEQQALRYMSLAQEYFPLYPEHDPSFLYADCGVNTLYQWQGKTYLRLVEHFPNVGYQQKAAESLLQSIGFTSISERSENETIIYQADAARVLGELEIYAGFLRKAVQMAAAVGSRRRYHDAFVVYQQTPEKWMKESHIQALATDLFKQFPGR